MKKASAIAAEGKCRSISAWHIQQKIRIAFTAIIESNVIASFNNGQIAPCKQLSRYEFQNPAWYLGRTIVSRSMNILENSIYGFKELAGSKIYLMPHQVNTIIRYLKIMQKSERTSLKRIILIVVAAIFIIIVGLLSFNVPCSMGIGTSSWNTIDYNGMSFRLPPDWKEEQDTFSDKWDREWYSRNYGIDCKVRSIDEEDSGDLYERYKSEGMEALVEDEFYVWQEREYVKISVKNQKEFDIDGIRCGFLRYTTLEQYPGDEDSFLEHFCLWVPVKDGKSMTQIECTNIDHRISDNGILKGILKTVSISKEGI